MGKTQGQAGYAYTVFRIIFYFCAFYFLLMGIGLVVFPRFLVQGVAGVEVHPALIGMLRGAGGAIIPYSLLYFYTAGKPLERKWGLRVIAMANVLAIILDMGSVLLDEYKLSYAMMDIPVEVLSLLGIALAWSGIREK